MDDKRSVVELLGLVAIVASLIFVGMEVRQAAVETRSSIVLQLKDSWVEFNLAILDNQGLFDAIQIVTAEGREANQKAKFTVDAWLRALFHNWSNAYFHYRNGTLDKAQWMANVRDAENGAQEQYVREFWTEWRHVYDDDFAAFVDDTFSKVDEDR